MMKSLLRQLKVVFFVLLLFASTNIFAQAQPCPLSNNQWQWPTHTNWYFGVEKGVSFGATGSSAPALTNRPTGGYSSYEGVASVSDENGNLVMYTNGVYLWNSVGTQIPVPGGRLKAGAENAAGEYSSAVQGVMIVKHPLNINEYYIFTTDDAISGAAGLTHGFNYSIYNKSTQTVTAPVRVGNYRTTEQIAATWHSNGVDIWVCTHESKVGGSTTFNAYLLTCSGLNTAPVQSNQGFNVAYLKANERSSLRFSWDGKKAASTNHCGDGNWDPVNSVAIMNFNQTTGVFSGSVGIGVNDVDHSNPYCCEFSPSNNRLYVTYMCDKWSTIVGKVGYYNLAAGNAYTNVSNLPISAGNYTHGGTIKLGGDSRMYVGGFMDNWAYVNNVGVVSTPDGAASYNASGLAVGAGLVGFGLPNMFIPPRDYLKIRDTSVTECDLPLDMGVKWKCKGTDAEDITLNGWSIKGTPVGGSITASNGIFNATAPGVYEVYYTICSIKDTALITVIACNCPVDLKVSKPKICIGNQVKLDSLVLGGPGVWSIDSVPTSAGTNPTLTISAGDTLFTSVTGNKIGTYKLLFKDPADASCRDSVYIVVNPLPAPNITSFGPLCKDSIVTTMTLTPAIVGGIGQWSIDGVPSTNQFDPTLGAIASGPHLIGYIHTDANGCVFGDTLIVVVKALKNATITQSGPFCSNASTVNLTAATAGGVWSGTGITNPASGTFNPNNAGAGSHVITYAFPGLCNSVDTMTIVVNPAKDATLSKHDSTVCTTDPSVNISVFPAQAGGVWTIISPIGSVGVITSPFVPGNYAAGDYKIEYSLANPCGDKDTLTMHVVGQFLATISVTAAQDTVCQSASAFSITKVMAGGTWKATCGICINNNGLFNPATATIGNNTVTYSNASNCGDTQTVNIFVLPIITSVITKDTALCVNQTFTPTNAWLPVDPATLGFPLVGVWHFIGAGNPLSLNAATGAFDAAIAGAGTYKITYSVSAYPCFNPDTITIRVDAMPNPLVTPVSPLCANAPVKVLAANTIGMWTTTAPAGSITGNNFNPAIAGAGNWEIRNTVTNGKCTAWDTITVNVKTVPVINLTPIPNQCLGSPLVDLTPYDQPDTGAWNGTGVTGTNFNPNSAGTKTLTYSIGGLCPVSKTIDVIVQTTPNPIIAGDSVICENIATGIQLTADDAGGIWVGQGINSSTGLFTNTGLAPGYYPLEYQMNNVLCKDTAFYTLRVLKVPKTDFVGDKLAGCVWLGVNYTDISDSVPVASIWQFNQGDGISDIIGYIPAKTYTTAGIYDTYLINTYANGCVSEELKEDYIAAYGIPNAEFTSTPDLISTVDPVASFFDQSTSDVVTWSWKFTNKGTPTTSALQNPQVSFNSIEDDTLTVWQFVTTAGGCRDSISHDVIIRTNTSIFVPNSFTPNDDGVNDAFIPRGINFGEQGYEFIVFNRWGEVIFKTNNATEPWNGKRSNTMQDAQIDVYVWKVTYVDHFSGIKQDPIVGHVSLIR